MNRRDFLGAAGALALPLGGCATLPRASPLRIVDAHCHVFNASDLPVQDYVERVVSFEKGIDPAAARSIARLLRALGSMAPTADEERRDLLAMRGLAGAAPLLDRLRLQRQSEDEAILEAVRARVEADPALRRDLQELALRGARSLLGTGGPVLLPQGLVARERLQRLLALPGPFEVWEFLKPMLRRRGSNCVALLDAHGGSDTVLFAAMVDFEGWLGDLEAASPIDSQVAVMAELAAQLPSRLRYYLPFNPLAEMRAPGTLARRKAALEMPHALGYKVYPSMGYAPAGNAALAPSERPLRWSALEHKYPSLASDLDRTMAAFLAHCSETHALLLAHGNPSFGPDAAADLLGSPTRWRQAIAGAGGDLRFIAGHFGGEGPGRADWREEWARLVDEFPHVHGDLSYWPSVLAGDPGSPAITELARRVREHPRLAQRLLFGSDWSMVALEPGWSRYREGFEAAMLPVFGADLPRVLSANALELATSAKERP